MKKLGGIVFRRIRGRIIPILQRAPKAVAESEETARWTREIALRKKEIEVIKRLHREGKMSTDLAKKRELFSTAARDAAGEMLREAQFRASKKVKPGGIGSWFKRGKS